MRYYQAEATINASPEVIWALLTDAPGYADWDSGAVSVDGAIAPGEKLKVTSEVNPKRAYPVRVSEFRRGEQMAWKGGMPLGLMTGVRTFTLAPDGGGATRFTVREEFTGPLVPLMWKAMPDMQPSFDTFASGLKARAERG